MYAIKVGSSYPGPVPPQDGLLFEIGPGGDMNLLVQYRRPSQGERDALGRGFQSYSLYNDPDSSVLCWVYRYPSPVSFMDAPFHAGLYQDDRILKMLESVANVLTVCVLDGELVQSIRLVGLHPKAIEAFFSRVRKQMEAPMTRAAYNAAIDRIYRRLSSKELYGRGMIFSHRETLQ